MRNLIRQSLAPAVGLSVAVGLSGCGGAGTGPDTDITKQEAQVIVQAISERAFAETFDYTGRGGAGNIVAAATTNSFSLSGSCPGGGTTEWSGEVTVNEDGSRVAFDGTVSFIDCASTVGGTTVTLTTTPDCDYMIEFTRVSETEFTGTSDFNGSFDWELPDKTGNCNLDIETEITGTAGGEGTANTSGSVCGREISHSFDVNI